MEVAEQQGITTPDDRTPRGVSLKRNTPNRWISSLGTAVKVKLRIWGRRIVEGQRRISIRFRGWVLGWGVRGMGIVLLRVGEVVEVQEEGEEEEGSGEVMEWAEGVEGIV